jgi:hypothetical protein
MKQAKATARRIGKADVDMGETACKVPLALEYIEKAEKSGRPAKCARPLGASVRSALGTEH